MKWFLVIFFIEGLGSYVFFDPSFETLDDCRFSANYPPHIAVYAQKMVEEFGKPRPVSRVVCMNEENLKTFLSESLGKHEGIDL